MKSIPLNAALILALTLGISCSKKKNNDQQPASNAYAIGSNNNLLAFNLSNPSTITSKTVTGLAPTEIILGIDIRPADGLLYAVTGASRLYTINVSTGAATLVGTFAQALTGTSYGVDFNPVADRLRVVNIADLNIRLNPANGTLAAKDTDISPNANAISAVAYTNNYTGAASTVLYGIEASTGSLFRLDNPNGGLLTLVGRTTSINADAANGFDISGQNNKAWVLFSTGGAAKLYNIDLQTGVFTELGDFPTSVRGLALALNQ